MQCLQYIVPTADAERLQKSVRPQNTYLGKQRGIVVLVDFPDCRFVFGDTVATFYDHQLNGDSFTSFINVEGTLHKCTGSVREYWRDNSFGKYDPQFDIVGPVEVDMPRDSVRYDDPLTVVQMMREAMDRAAAMVDVADYDSDNDGCIDFVVVIAAGALSQQGLLPHVWMNGLMEPYCDATWGGKRIDDCVVLTELSGPSYISPVGIFCHQFAYLLGLTNVYAPPESYSPGEWDMMYSGYALNHGLTPAGLSLFERMRLGFTQVEAVADHQSYTLAPLHESNMGYMLESPLDSSFFMLENRQKVKWDAYLPGHGLLVSRVALSPDDDKYHGQPYVGIVRSGLEEVEYANNRDTYPGPGQVRILGTGTMSNPYVFSFGHQYNVYPASYLYDIEENDGVVSFNVVPNAETTRITEEFNKMATTPTMVERQWQGQNFIWDFYSAGVEECTDSLMASEFSGKPLKMSMPSKVETSNYVGHNVYQLSIEAWSPGTNTASAKVTLSYSTDGKKWVTARSITGNQYNMVEPGDVKRIGWSLDEPAPVVYRIAVTTNKAENHLYFERLRIEYRDDAMPGDVNEDGNVDIDDLNMVINVILRPSRDANQIPQADLTGDGVVDIDDVNAVVNHILSK